MSEPSAERRLIITKLALRGVETVDPLQLPLASDSFGHYDIVIDCSGYPPAITAAIPLLDTGGKILLFGCCPKASKISIEPF